MFGNIGRHEISDHVAALKQLTGQRPYMDSSRVGINGSSYGGYFAVRAMLLAPDVYHVGVAIAACVDLYDQYFDEVEPYMGLPQKNRDAYEYADNLRLSGSLKGKLLLIHGTSDPAVQFAHSMKMVEALLRAGRPYDLFVAPDQGHDRWSRTSGR